MTDITIVYPETGNAPVSVSLCYKIEQSNDLQTIFCTVQGGERVPTWLQLRKFEIAAMKVKGGYMTLYNEKNEDKNLDCSLFIDLAYSEIMKKEKRKVCEPA